MEQAAMLRPVILVLSLTTLITTTVSPALAVTRAAKKSVAVLYFDNNTGKPEYDALGRGIASMMITDLGGVEEIQLVEREHIQELVKEMDRQGTKYFDSTTAVKVGRMTGAEFVIVGSFTALQPKMRIDTRVLRVQTAEIVKSAQATGNEDAFFDIEQKLAKNLIDGLGIALSPEEQQHLAQKQEQDRVDQLSTMLTFSQALALYDRADYTGAATMMAPAIQASPRSALLRFTYDEMKRRAASTAADKAKEKVKAGIGGLLRRP